MAKSRWMQDDDEVDDGRFEGDDGSSKDSTRACASSWLDFRSRRGRRWLTACWVMLLVLLGGLAVGDETKRESPHDTIVAQGQPPQPGPRHYPFAEFEDFMAEEF